MDRLSSEDSLRLNVLLASKPQAVRIDESKMIVFGLVGEAETKVVLNPNCRDDLYLRRVRELISGHVLGSPGGYPVYLSRWTRMGQARDESLEQLLLLGEPEAVVAVVHASGLTGELARRAWWAMPSAENARRMLQRSPVATGGMSRILAEYLVEYLPFEEEPANMIESIRLVLQPGLIEAPVREAIWKRARNKTAYLVGFLMGAPDDLPETMPARADLPARRPRLASLSEQGNAYASLLLRVLDGPGQAYLDACSRALKKPVNQDVVNLLLDTIAHYFSPVRPSETNPDAELPAVVDQVEALLESARTGKAWSPPELDLLLREMPDLEPDVKAILILSRVGYPVVRPIFSRTTAIGSLMRRKLEPVSGPIEEQLACLRGEPS